MQQESKPMPKYQIVVAIDVPYYKSVVIEAASASQAATQALVLASTSDAPFEPDWDCAGEVRIACDPDECELP
jgi:hypothetical protein